MVICCKCTVCANQPAQSAQYRWQEGGKRGGESQGSGGGQGSGADVVKLGHIQALKNHNVYHLQPWTMSAYLEPDPRARDVTFLDQ